MRLAGTTLPRVRPLLRAVRKIPVSGYAKLTQGQDSIEADACRWMWSASFPTRVKDVVTPLVKSRGAISNAMGVSVTKGMEAISLAFTRSR
jgi:hypothetical protein